MRLWGPLTWVTAKTAPRLGRFVLLGCLGFEDRHSATLDVALGNGLSRALMLEIEDPPSRYSDACNAKRAQNRVRLQSDARVRIAKTSLFARAQDIRRIVDDLVQEDLENTELWIDISCLPKRYFFLLVKAALSAGLNRVLATYTQPAPGRYTEEHLSGDPDEVRALPGFGPKAIIPDLLVVAMGFEQLGLAQLIGEYRDRRSCEIALLVPFPPGQPYARRVWESIIGLRFERDVASAYRVPAVDAFGTYDALIRQRSVEEAQGRPVVLAPYGPKPLSLGMCLYAIEADVPVMYTQPRIYHPEYTVGVGESWGYWLRRNGADLWRPERRG